jgi:hypothetical protein
MKTIKAGMLSLVCVVAPNGLRCSVGANGILTCVP